jgi:hypothetical protein
MLIFMKTRQQSRDLANRRKASGYPAKALDMGKGNVRRFAVDLHPARG